jgi:hypothetical protein
VSDQLLRSLNKAFVVILVAVMATSVPGVPLLDLGGVEAQDSGAQPKKRSFFDKLFGLRRPVEPPVAKAKRQPGRRAPAPRIEVIAKDEDARRILVVGDFVAGAVARGLDQAFAEESGLMIINRSNGNSGLVRDDYYDWGRVLPGFLDEEKPDIVVVVIGSNDRQQITRGGKRYAPLSESWEKIYARRIAGIADTLKVSARPFFWVGAPPMRGRSASRDMSHFNGLYKSAVVEAGGFFIDVWNGFTDENGNFVSSGPDVDGQLRALRTKDGINFTRAGRLKLAFFVEREIKRQTGIGMGATDVLLQSSAAARIEIGPDGKKRLVGPVISLAGPRPGAGETLAGDSEQEGGIEVAADGRVPATAVNGVAAGIGAARADLAEPGGETPINIMIIKGAALAPVAGRADDYTWPHSSAAAPGSDVDSGPGPLAPILPSGI